jgi:hypothetical protein
MRRTLKKTLPLNYTFHLKFFYCNVICVWLLLKKINLSVMLQLTRLPPSNKTQYFTVKTTKLRTKIH